MYHSASNTLSIVFPSAYTASTSTSRERQTFCSYQRGILATFGVVLSLGQRLLHLPFWSDDDDWDRRMRNCESGHGAHAGSY